MEFIKHKKGNLIIAKDLEETVFKALNLEYELLLEIKGEELENLTYTHPLYNRISRIILGEHVTNEAGTGCVHTAPGHGEDDYKASLKYNIGLLSVVDNKGHMNKEAQNYEGMFYKKANKYIIEDLDKNGSLLGQSKINHSYPHDWRSKQPVIFRATEQWFIKVDGEVREKALEKLKEVEFVPKWKK